MCTLRLDPKIYNGVAISVLEASVTCHTIKSIDNKATSDINKSSVEVTKAGCSNVLESIDNI